MKSQGSFAASSASRRGHVGVRKKSGRVLLYRLCSRMNSKFIFELRRPSSGYLRTASRLASSTVMYLSNSALGRGIGTGAASVVVGGRSVASPGGVLSIRDGITGALLIGVGGGDGGDGGDSGDRRSKDPSLNRSGSFLVNMPMMPTTVTTITMPAKRKQPDMSYATLPPPHRGHLCDRSFPRGYHV
jgi:hypothetical protein